MSCVLLLKDDKSKSKKTTVSNQIKSNQIMTTSICYIITANICYIITASICYFTTASICYFITASICYVITASPV